MDTHYVGKSVPWLDGLEKVTRRAVYTVDVEMLGMLHGAVLRSPHAHARVVDIDAAEAPNADTAVIPYDSGVTSSRITFHMGNAVRLAGEEVRCQILNIAAEVLKTDPGGLTLSEGIITGEGVERPMAIKTLLARKYPRGCSLMAEGHYSPAGHSWPRCRDGSV